MPSAARPPRDPGATPLEIAVSSAEDLEREWTDHVTHGLGLLLNDFDKVPLTAPARQALNAARCHLLYAQQQIRILYNEFLEANAGHVYVYRCVPVPKQLLSDIEGSKGRLAVYTWLQSCYRVDPRISIKRLAGLCKMAEDDVRSAIRWLCDAGWLRIEAIPGSANAYIPLTTKQEGTGN
jgi:hypothetical protein